MYSILFIDIRGSQWPVCVFFFLPFSFLYVAVSVEEHSLDDWCKII